MSIFPQLFAVKYFRLKTNQKNLRNLNIEYIISSSLSDPETNSSLDQIIITVDGFVDREVAENRSNIVIRVYLCHLFRKRDTLWKNIITKKRKVVDEKG